MINGPLRNWLRSNFYGVKRGLTHTKSLLTDRNPKLLVITYHRVKPETGPNPLNTIVSTETFVRQVEQIAGKMPVISLADAASQCRNGTIKRGIQAVLSFDDGYIDNYEIAFPLLKKKGLPAVFFLSTAYIGKGSPLWDFEVIMRILDTKSERIDAGSYLAVKTGFESLASFVFRVFDELKSRDFTTVEKAIRYLRGKRSCGYDFSGDHCMGWDQAAEMARTGMEIGAHGVTHRSLSRIPLSEAIEEIMESKSAVERNTGRPCFNFAFPFGSRRDYSAALIGEVKKAGFNACLLNIHGYNHMRPDFFALRRIIMDEDTDLRFLLG